VVYKFLLPANQEQEILDKVKSLTKKRKPRKKKKAGQKKKKKKQ